MRSQGNRAVDWLAEELTSAGWQVVARRWSSRYGELDLVLMGGGLVAFVEVKARSRLGLDQGGRLAITPAKQRKLIRTAQLFLAQYPDLADYPCRFDVALLQITPKSFVLLEYLSGAFEASDA